MPTYNKKPDFFDTDEGREFEKELLQMASNSEFFTKSSYSANSNLHPDNMISFVEKHKAYIRQNKHVNPQHYLSNLRLMTKIH